MDLKMLKINDFCGCENEKIEALKVERYLNIVYRFI
jgi:hypothetical protein